MENLVEGLNFNIAKDADLLKIESIFAVQNPQATEKEIAQLVKDAMNNAKPVALTGQIKKDAIKVIEYLDSAFKQAGITLDVKNANISSENIIDIPLSDFTKICFNINLEYFDVLNNGGDKKFVIQGKFGSYDNYYNIDFIDSITDINDNTQIVKIVSDLKLHLDGGIHPLS
jgi:hypothetical protein